MVSKLFGASQAGEGEEGSLWRCTKDCNVRVEKISRKKELSKKELTHWKRENIFHIYKLYVVQHLYFGAKTKGKIFLSFVWLGLYLVCRNSETNFR